MGPDQTALVGCSCRNILHRLFLKQFSNQDMVISAVKAPVHLLRYKLLKKELTKFAPVQQVQLFKK